MRFRPSVPGVAWLLLAVAACEGATEPRLPAIDAISPASGGFDDPITISGRLFSADQTGNTVTFNGVEAVVESASETELVALVPKGAGSGPVRVTVGGVTVIGPEFTYELTAIVSTWAGSGASGHVDGEGTNASFWLPRGVAVTPDGGLVVADNQNNAIRLIDNSGGVSTLAGGNPRGFVDGTGSAARFFGPSRVATAPDGSFYVSDQVNHAIRHVTAAGEVTTLAGDGTAGTEDGVGSTARFTFPSGIVVDAAGTVYVAGGGHKVRVVSPGGTVTTLAGTGESGFADGPGASAQFSSITGMTIGPDEMLYLADFTSHRIRRVSRATGEVGTVAGTGTSGFQDGPADQATFSLPMGVAVAPDGTIYVTDRDNHAVRRIGTDGVVTTIVGDGTAGDTDGPGDQARLDWPFGIVLHPDGSLFVGDRNNNRIRRITFE